MAIKHRKQTGALTPVQLRIIQELHAGRTVTQQATQQGIKVQNLSTEMYLVRAKMGVATNAQAVARYACHRELLRVAGLLLRSRVSEPTDSAEEHVNHVLDDLAALFRGRAEGLMPS